jgi:hypothetical protein
VIALFLKRDPQVEISEPMVALLHSYWEGQRELVELELGLHEPGDDAWFKILMDLYELWDYPSSCLDLNYPPPRTLAEERYEGVFSHGFELYYA